MGRVAQSVQRLTTGWMIRGSNPGGRDFPPFQTGPGIHPASCTIGTGSFPGVKYGRGLLLTTHPLRVLRYGRVELYLYHPLGHNRACNGITLPLWLMVNGYRHAYPSCCGIDCVRGQADPTAVVVVMKTDISASREIEITTFGCRNRSRSYQVDRANRLRDSTNYGECEDYCRHSKMHTTMQPELGFQFATV